MKGRTKALAIATGSAIITFSLVALATAGSGASPREADTQAVDQTGLPEGPFIDFCPTMEQIDAHLDKYGFDYKPTVPCGENGEELKTSADEQGDLMSEQELNDARKQELLSATLAPDKDGSPLTMEMILADGTEAVLFIDGDPEVYKDMTPAEYAELTYP